MVFLQLAQLLYRGLLQHALEYRRRTAVRDKHSMVFGDVRSQPQAVAHHIGLGNGLQRLGGAYQHVATHYHRMHILGGCLHHLLVEWHLQRQQVLRETLSALPAEHGNGGENLPRRSISRQTAALSASMQQDALLFPQPLAERLPFPQPLAERPGVLPDRLLAVGRCIGLP